MELTGENRSTRWKTCPNATLSTTNPTWTDHGIEPGPPLNRLSHGTAIMHLNTAQSYAFQSLRYVLYAQHHSVAVSELRSQLITWPSRTPDLSPLDLLSKVGWELKTTTCTLQNRRHSNIQETEREKTLWSEPYHWITDWSYTSLKTGISYSNHRCQQRRSLFKRRIISHPINTWTWNIGTLLQMIILHATPCHLAPTRIGRFSLQDIRLSDFNVIHTNVR